MWKSEQGGRVQVAGDKVKGEKGVVTGCAGCSYEV